MSTSRRVSLLLASVCLPVATAGLTVTSEAAPLDNAGPQGRDVAVQLLSFNDYHGHLQPPGGSSATLGAAEDPSATPVGGAEFLATHLDRLREGVQFSTTVAAGDLIGGSPFLSGLFHDEPAVESLDALGLDVSSVGNHEFDEGVTELLRMQHGGCHPEDGCYTDTPYAGAGFDWLAANVRYKDGTERAGETVLPPYSVERYQGIDVAYIGMTLENTPEIVAASGIRDVEFLDEARTANALVPVLKEQGIEAIVVLVHEGGFAPGGYDGCEAGGTLSDPIQTIHDNLDPEIDLVVTGHTHSPYVCRLTDPAGQPRHVTSASSFGRVVTETWLHLDQKTKDVRRDLVTSQNHLVSRDVEPDPAQTAIIGKWQELAAPIANRVVGTISEDIVRGPSRQVESGLVNLVADAQLAATDDPAEGGAVAAFMNPGGVRADFTFSEISGNEQPGEVTYGEAFTVQPFGNLVVSLELTGAQIEQVLEQQFTATGVRLLLGVSEGFSYTYDLGRPVGDRIDPATIRLDGVTLDPGRSYRITANSFLADGGDGFTVFGDGTSRIGGGEDLPALLDYFAANPGVGPASTDRVTELP